LNYLSSVLSQIKSPFPYSRGLSAELKSALRVSVFAMILIYFLRPFGLQNASLEVLAGYWIVTAGVAMLNILFFNTIVIKFINQNSWTVGKEMIRTVFYLLIIAIGIMIFTNLRFDSVLDIGDILVFAGYTILIGIIPAFIRVMSIHNWLLKKNLKEATGLNSFLKKSDNVHSEKVIRIESEVVKESFETTNKRLLYLESEQHYVNIFHQEKESVNTTMIRLGLSKAVSQINDDYIKQCHRSYAVNLRMVANVKSNSQGLRLCLKIDNIEVPVSRSFKKQITELLKTINN
jgi:LytTr DNA-binding domain-containing protein